MEHSPAGAGHCCRPRHAEARLRCLLDRRGELSQAGAGEAPTATATTLATGADSSSWGSGPTPPTCTPAACAKSAAPNHIRAKLNAAYRFISWGAIPIEAAVGGLLAARYGRRTAMNIAALGRPLTTICGAASTIPHIERITDINPITATTFDCSGGR